MRSSAAGEAGPRRRRAGAGQRLAGGLGDRARDSRRPGDDLRPDRRPVGNVISPAAVGWAMHVCPEDVPWHRVVNARGGCSTERLPDMPPDVQRRMLRPRASPSASTARSTWRPALGPLGPGKSRRRGGRLTRQVPTTRPGAYASSHERLGGSVDARSKDECRSPSAESRLALLAETADRLLVSVWRRAGASIGIDFTSVRT